MFFRPHAHGLKAHIAHFDRLALGHVENEPSRRVGHRAAVPPSHGLHRRAYHGFALHVNHRAGRSHLPPVFLLCTGLHRDDNRRGLHQSVFQPTLAKDFIQHRSHRHVVALQRDGLAAVERRVAIAELVLRFPLDFAQCLFQTHATELERHFLLLGHQLKRHCQKCTDDYADQPS